MLKKVYINGRSMPVPVPVRTLFEASNWISQHFVPEGSTITKVILDGHAFDDQWWNPAKSHGVFLRAESRLELKIESPIDLAVQTLDAIHNFAEVILRGAKPIAVEMWQAASSTTVSGSTALSDDCQLVRTLIDHAASLIGSLNIETDMFQRASQVYMEAMPSVLQAVQERNWKEAAKALLNRVEPALKELIIQADSLQVRLLASRPSLKEIAQKAVASNRS